MKAQITLCVLLVSAASLHADDAAVQSAFLPPANPAAAQGVPTPSTQPASPEAFTAPPIIVGPDGGSIISQYPPQPGVAQPFGDPFANPMPTPYGAPYGIPSGSPGGLIDPGLADPIFPYPSLTPDVTMLPAPVNGPMPNRYGWTHRYDFGVLPNENATDGLGKFGVFEFDLAWKYNAPLYPIPGVFSFTQQYDLRLWDGPETPAGSTINLPGSVQRIGWDFELKSASTGPWSAVAAFNPSINSDFEKSLSSNAWNWDGRGAVMYTPSKEITYVMGAAYWDRVNDRILPWAGVIYRPNDYWQWDLVFPQLRVSMYLWDELGFRTSLYARAEYHIEAYEIRNTILDQRDKVEIQDWRALLGFNKDQGQMAYFFEGGWVFGRNVNFKNAPHGFDVATGVILRGGVRF